MSVPLDRLYHYLADCVNHDVLIYRWSPPGSRKLEDLRAMIDYNFVESVTWMPMICHDQEPLNFDFHTVEDFKKLSVFASDWHFRGLTDLKNVYDRVILLHSEQGSNELTKFEQHGFIPVYYWSHALIAPDWFRYAEHDPVLEHDVAKFNKDFLIYNRAWSGTREYRLKFAQQLLMQKLVPNCHTSFSPTDSGVWYHDHQFVNAEFAIDQTDLDQHLPPNVHDSAASADYCNHDYASTAIEVVLETLFDDRRWHLTEKILRPIACGKPFILAATAGSLEYLRSYGFQTFGQLIDESYDQIKHAPTRLQAIIAEMKRISQLSADQKSELYVKMHEIARHNKIHFFTKLHQHVMSEYLENLNQAVLEMQAYRNGKVCAEHTLRWLSDADYQSRYTPEQKSEILDELAWVTDWLDQNAAVYNAMRDVNTSI